MSRFTYFILVLLILAGCGKGDTDVTGSSSEEKVVNIGAISNFAPFEYLDKGEHVGFDIDFIKAVAEEAGYKSEIKEYAWDALFVATQTKEVDVAISAIGVNEDRKQTFDFSDPYFKSTHLIVVKDGSDIANATELIGKKIGALNGSSGQKATEKIVGKNSSSITKYETTTDAFIALEHNDVEAVVTDDVAAVEYVKNNPKSSVKTIEDKESFDSEYYALMFPKGSEIKADFDAAVKEVLESGKYTEIYKKWFGKDPDINGILAAPKQ